MSSFRIHTLNISPVRPGGGMNSIYNQQTQRREFYENLGGEIKQALERINKALEPPPSPMPDSLTGTNIVGDPKPFEEIRQQYVELSEVLSDVAVENDTLKRGFAVANINSKLEANEKLLLMLASDPNRPALEGAIVRRQFVLDVLGRAPGTISSLDNAREKKQAFWQTRIPIPEVILLQKYDLEQIFSTVGTCTASSISKY